jgi:DNA-binding MarR family transcriptional regulator
LKKRSDMVAEIIDNLRRVFQVVNGHSKQIAKETGLTGPQLWAIKTISQNAPLMVSQLARRMYLHPATVVGILNRLEKQGLVIRKRSTEDHRVVMAELTRQGRALLKKAPVVAQGLLVAGLEKLADQKLKNIELALDQLTEILGAQNVPPRLILSPGINRPRKKTAPAAGASRETASVRKSPAFPKTRRVVNKRRTRLASPA